MGEKQVCFVVMGFGKKTDYPTGRVINLDKSYQYIIKPAEKQDWNAFERMKLSTRER
jgi:hypothetical protein